MATSKVILAVVVVAAIAFAQIEARPSTTDKDWASDFELLYKNLTTKVTELVGSPANITENVKNSLTSYADKLKEEVSSYSKTLENNSGISDIVKNATQQYHSAIETLTKNLPADLTPQKLTEKYQEAQKALVSQVSELNKKVQGNTEWEKEISAFASKQYDTLSKQIQSIQTTLTDTGKQ